MKGGLAAMVYAAKSLIGAEVQLAGDLAGRGQGV
jgi:acetylornithine deacetylase/succinyl-diaminopimelate desuccinylase-like protein